MNENITYHKLMQWHRELQALKQNDHILYRLLRSRVEGFYKANGVRINSFLERVREVDKFWIEHDQDGKMLYEGEGQNRLKKLKEGNTKEQYETATKAMWDEIIAVDF